MEPFCSLKPPLFTGKSGQAYFTDILYGFKYIFFALTQRFDKLREDILKRTKPVD